MNYMRQNNFFSDKQFGFISGRSTSLQLLTVLDKWSEAIDAGLSVDCIYMDFQKAFDTVPHRRLIGKLNSFKMASNMVKWIEDFLTDRTQYIIINGSSSDCHKVTSGIPQGSVLGPLLFVIFINDLPGTVDSESFLFADDTKIFRTITTDKDRQALQEDLDKLGTWSEQWLLKFHPEKCKHMHIGRQDPPQDKGYTLCNTDIQKTSQEKDIGVIIDDELSFDVHIATKIKKANSMLDNIQMTTI